MGGEVDNLATAKARLASRLADRLDWLTRIHNRIWEQFSVGVNTRSEDCKRAAQQSLIAAERNRDEQIAQTNANYANFQQRLNENDAAFQQLEQPSAMRLAAQENSVGCSLHRPRKLKFWPTMAMLLWTKSSASVPRLAKM
jgi:hypothetical protein